MPDTTLSTLEKIKVKIRRLTRAPSESQISEATLNDYINTFVLYDFPEHLKLFRLRTNLVFYTQPYIDVYAGDDIVTNFDNLYTTVYENAYVAGNKQMFTQSTEQFYALYPKLELVKSIGTTGNGVLTNFTGTLSSIPILRNIVSFTSIAANNVGLEMHDVPNVPNDGSGTFTGDIGAAGAINYTTGVYNITFDTPPALGQTIYSQTVPYTAGLPSMILYFNNKLTFRPVPDKVYRVELEVAIRPTEMLANSQMPEISQWWQYIAYGAAKKIFEDRMDMESLQMIMPEFKQQEALVNRRTIDQISKDRSSTIYAEVDAAVPKSFYK